jgi:hypothetical protein
MCITEQDGYPEIPGSILEHGSSLMTGEQKKWLDDHRAEGYRPVGNAPGAQGKYVKVGMLYPDGTFERRSWNLSGRYARAEAGMFECGILEV